MKYSLFLATLAGFSFTACSTYTQTVPQNTQQVHEKKEIYEKPTPQKLKAYQKTMLKIALGIKDDPRYNKIALKTAQNKAWFRDLTYRLWDRQITRYQFITEGLKKYPTHRYEFEFIVRGFSS